MTKTISAGLQAHLGLETTTLATLWRIIRTDGQEFFFTDHDADITFDGNVYESAFGYNRTAVDNKVGLSVDNLDVYGFLDSSALTEVELRAGLFDYAEVRVSVVNFEDLSQGELKLRRGRFGEVSYADSGVFKTELRGMTQAYSQNIVELLTPECRADLGDSRCGIPISPSVLLRSTTYAAGDYVKTSSLLEGVPDASLLVPGDVDENDISVTGLTGTLGSEAAQQTVVSKFGGGAIEFSPTATVDPSNSFLSFPDNNVFFFDTGEFTIEGWFRWKSVTSPSNVMTLASQYLNTGNQRAWVLRWNGTLPAIDFLAYSNGTTNVVNTATGSFTPTLGQWYHIAVTRDAAGDIRIFIDGTQSGAGANYTGTIFNSNATMYIGKLRSAGFGDQPFNGFADDFRIVKGYAAYTGTFTPPTAALPTGPAALIPTLVASDFDNRIYRCTVGGTTGPVQPTFDTTVGQDTVDGTATFRAEQAWTRDAVVATVTDNRNFSITVDETRAVDDWFKYGAVIWETGNNAGLAMEVKHSEADASTGSTQLNVTANNTFARPAGDFIADGFEVGMKIVTTGFSNAANNGTFTIATVATTTITISETTLVNETGSGDETMTAPDGIELFLSMPFDIQVGDTLTVYAGCDKKLATCIAKFNNAVNFRGEPFVPGPDAYLSIKTRTGTVSSSGGKF